MHLYEKQASSSLKFDGKIVKLYLDKAVLENGEKVSREVIKHPGGVCVVALNEQKEVLLVRQFRYPFARILTELPAGKLEFGEDPLSCGIRELEEETGYYSNNFVSLGFLYPTPAYCNEIIHIYLAQNLVKKEQKLDKDEFLEVISVPIQEAVNMVFCNKIQDAKTQLGILKAASYLKLL